MQQPFTDAELARMFVGHGLRLILSCARERSLDHLSSGEHHIPEDFFGLCVASAPDPATDDYVLARLRELRLRHVRVDLSPGADDSFAHRFLGRLLADGFRVCLHPVQPHDEARAMQTTPAQERWREFLVHTLTVTVRTPR